MSPIAVDGEHLTPRRRQGGNVGGANLLLGGFARPLAAVAMLAP